MAQLASLGPGDAVRMQHRAAAGRQAANRIQADGNRIGALIERAMADKLANNAALALDPVLHTTGRVTVGNGGEVAIGTRAMAQFVDVVRVYPNMVVIDASRQRIDLEQGGRAFYGRSMLLRRSQRATAWIDADA